MRPSTRAVCLLSVLSAALASCVGNSDRGSSPQPTREGFVTANGVRLHYVEWGDAGPALVLVHGYAASPHLFGDLATLLQEDFRVVSYARRGHGQSDAPEGPYDNATLVEDLRQLLDSLGINQAHLLGWSMGGNEITAFAGTYPERALRLIYLEGGYDWSDAAFGEAFAALPVDLQPDSAALQSLDAYRDWFRGLFMRGVDRTPSLEAFLGDITTLDTDGRVRPVPGGRAAEELMASLTATRRDYGRVRSPALALYGETQFDVAAFGAQDAQALTDWESGLMEPFRLASIERIQREMPGVTVRRIENTTHVSIGLVRLQALADTIRNFLLEPR